MSTDKKAVELLADYAHAAWAGWMEYLFSRCHHGHDGSLMIPVEFVDHWKRQVRTPYSELPENEAVKE
ncbi:MAG: hypothetical protein ACE5EX_11765, partial [Phycisphaerae bacterium]